MVDMIYYHQYKIETRTPNTFGEIIFSYISNWKHPNPSPQLNSPQATLSHTQFYNLFLF